MKELHNIKRVSRNEVLRRFTIYKECGAKYRTLPMSKEEFEINDNNTLNDWNQFLKTEEYFKMR